jgi:hypothetical protein
MKPGYLTPFDRRGRELTLPLAPCWFYLAAKARELTTTKNQPKKTLTQISLQNHFFTKPIAFAIAIPLGFFLLLWRMGAYSHE